MTILYKFICVFAAASGMFLVPNSTFAQVAPIFFAPLNGGNECDNSVPPNCRRGDLDGFGGAVIIIALPNTVCWGITVDNLTSPPSPMNLAHIHSGVSGLNGPIVVTLSPPVAPSAGNPGASSGCTSGVPVATINAIRLNPTGFYVNVHNAAFPPGAVRGQLQ